MRKNDFDVSDIRNLPAVGMLYQTGYLTIKDYENGYAMPYLADGRPVWAIGLAFDSKTRQLTDAKEECLA